MKDIIIKKIPWCKKVSPLMWRARAIAQYPDTILLDGDLYSEYESGTMSLYLQGIIEHEKYHFQRMKEIGQFKFRFTYAFSSKFRLQEELDADRNRFKFLKQNGGEVDLEKRAQLLSGPLYFWMISREQALIKLQELWDQQ